MKEVDWQTKLVKRLKNEGQYARKAAHGYAAGVLDLNVVVNGVYMAVECKLEQNLHNLKSRVVQFTEVQKIEADWIRRSGGNAFGLVFAVKGPRDVMLVPFLMPKHGEQAASITEQIIADRGVPWYPKDKPLAAIMQQWAVEYNGID